MRGVVAVELFRCAPLSVKLTRTACADRHSRAKGRALTNPRGTTPLVGPERCAGCELGAAHARSETPASWPDGKPVEIVAAAPEPGSSRWLTPAPRSEERSDPAALPPGDDRRAPRSVQTTPARRGHVAERLLEHNGKTLSISAWAREPEVKELGLEPKSISWRLANGWSVEDALTRGRQQGKAVSARPKPVNAKKQVSSTKKHVSSRGSKPVRGEAGRTLAETIATLAMVTELGQRSAPAELLAAAGYSVTETRCPRGVVLIVEIDRGAA